MAVQVHAADIQDRDGAGGVLKRSRRAFPFVEQVFADGGYAGRLGSSAGSPVSLHMAVGFSTGMQRRATAHSSFCSSIGAPTRRMTALRLERSRRHWSAA